MKIDRLLSIIVYLMNRDLVSARKLSEKFGVSIRTIQRDMETIELAGIPVVSIQGPNGGYGIMENYRMDRQLVSVEDLYYIILSLKSVASTLDDGKIDTTLEKMKTLLPPRESDFFTDREGKLSIDFSMLLGNMAREPVFQAVREAVNAERLLSFTYTSNRMETSRRTIEPMTLVFQWRAWYLFGWCTLRNDFRLFRVSRIREPEICPGRFIRRDVDFNAFMKSQNPYGEQKTIDFVLRFEAFIRPMVKEYYPAETSSEGPDGSLIVKTAFPDDDWVYGYLLSFGPYLTLLEPPQAVEALKKMAAEVKDKY